MSKRKRCISGVIKKLCSNCKTGGDVSVESPESKLVTDAGAAIGMPREGLIWARHDRGPMYG